MHTAVTAIVAASLLFCVSNARAETVILKSGKSIQGKVSAKTASTVTLQVFNTDSTVTFHTDEVAEITEDSAGTNPPAVDAIILENPGFGRMIQEILKSVTAGEMDKRDTPEDPLWALLYYHHNKDAENLPAYRAAIQKDQKVMGDPKVKAYVERFFLPAQDRTELRADNAENIDLLWADFRATGDKEPIKKIAGILSLEQTPGNMPLIQSAEISLLYNCLRNLDAQAVLEKEAALAPPGAQSRLEGIKYVLETIEEIAGEYQGRAHNFAKLGQDEEAFKSYFAALHICPDYGIVLNNLSNLYQRVRHDDGKYRLYAQAAVYNNPEHYSAAYNLGIYYFTRGEYAQAIKYYSQALEYQPKKPEYNHAIARAYQEKGDTANAVKYFKIYLDLAPHAEHERLVRAYLASVNAPVQVEMDDPNVMLTQGRYDDLENYFRGLLTRKEKDENGYSKLSTALNRLEMPEAMGAPLEERQPLILAWVQAKPRSHFANALAGIFYMDYAWEARGSGFSNTVVEKGAELFDERLKKAEEYLTKAYESDPSDPIVPANMLIVARGLGFEFDDMETWFQRAVKADPGEYLGYLAKLTYLMPKWHGSREQMFAFARESAKNASPKTLIPEILIEAHKEMYWRDDSKRYFKDDPIAWQETKDTFERILKDFPGANIHRNEYALAAYRAGDFPKAREIFAQIGDKWESCVWNSKKSFERTREEVQ